MNLTWLPLLMHSAPLVLLIFTCFTLSLVVLYCGPLLTPSNQAVTFHQKRLPAVVLILSYQEQPAKQTQNYYCEITIMGLIKVNYTVHVHATVVCSLHTVCACAVRNSRVMFPSTQLLSDNKRPVTVINDGGSVPACCLCALLQQQLWMEPHALAGRRACASLLVSFCSIPQVNTSTYLRPCTLLPAFPLSCRACPWSLMFFGLGKTCRSESWKLRCRDWWKDKGGARTYTTWHIHQGALKSTGLWLLAA